MNLLADESIDRPIVVRLRQDGHDVLNVTEAVVKRIEQQNASMTVMPTLNLS